MRIYDPPTEDRDGVEVILRDNGLWLGFVNLDWPHLARLIWPHQLVVAG
jgi:hypothetical protein